MSAGHERSRYQALRAHLAYLKLHAAAEAVPDELERAHGEQLGHTAFLERLLSIEVEATEACRLAGRLRFASAWAMRPSRPATASTTPPPPIWRRAVTGRRSRAAGRPRCASSAGRGF